jgi:hypothetical protein
VAGALVAVVGMLVAPPARSQESCRTRCWDAYGACYKSTSNRQRCQAQLFRCLSNCIRAKRSPATEVPAPTRSSAMEFWHLWGVRQLLRRTSCAGLSAGTRRQVRLGARWP